MHLFQSGAFVLHSGGKSHWKVDADALASDDWTTVARIIADRFEFREVEGVPRGGLALEVALWQYRQRERSELPILLVDDVLSTGASMEAQRAGRTDVIGVVLFHRSLAKPAWIHALWQFALPQRKI